jgi:hypothetical protein
VRLLGRVLLVALVCWIALAWVERARAADCLPLPDSLPAPPATDSTTWEVRELRRDLAQLCAFQAEDQTTFAAIAAATSSTSTAAASTRDRLPLELDVDGRLKVAELAGDGGGTLELTAGDRERLDLSWWGIWTVAGFILVLISAPLWEKAWRFWRE